MILSRPTEICTIYAAEQTQPPGSTMFKDCLRLSSEERTPVIGKLLLSLTAMKKEVKDVDKKVDQCQLEGSSYLL